MWVSCWFQFFNVFTCTAEGKSLACAGLFFCVDSIEYTRFATLYPLDPGHGFCCLGLFKWVSLERFKLTARLAKTLDWVLEVKGCSLTLLDIGYEVGAV